MSTKELLAAYYSGLAKKSGWEPTLAEDFTFTGGSMLNPQKTIGSAAYVAVINRFSRLFTNVRPILSIIDGDKAYVTANYDFVFPQAQELSGNIAEVWEVSGGKLKSLTIYFDTLAFKELTTPKHP